MPQYGCAATKPRLPTSVAGPGVLILSAACLPRPVGKAANFLSTQRHFSPRLRFNPRGARAISSCSWLSQSLVASIIHADIGARPAARPGCGGRTVGEARLGRVLAAGACNPKQPRLGCFHGHRCGPVPSTLDPCWPCSGNRRNNSRRAASSKGRKGPGAGDSFRCADQQLSRFRAGRTASAHSAPWRISCRVTPRPSTRSQARTSTSSSPNHKAACGPATAIRCCGETATARSAPKWRRRLNGRSPGHRALAVATPTQRSVAGQLAAKTMSRGEGIPLAPTRGVSTGVPATKQGNRRGQS